MRVALYARVSRDGQTTENQTIPLIQYCQRMNWEYELFVETESTRNTRPIQYALYQRLLRKEFDGLVIYKFDRWARSTKELIEHIEALIQKNVLIYSYSENIDLNSSMGRAMLGIISVFAQLERDLIRERTLAGLARAKAQGKNLGRPRKYAFDASWSEKTTELSKIHHEIRRVSRKSNIKEKNCSLCGSLNKLQIHHLDYAKPELVQTLCENCHLKIHGKRGAVNPSIIYTQNQDIAKTDVLLHS